MKRFLFTTLLVFSHALSLVFASHASAQNQPPIPVADRALADELTRSALSYLSFGGTVDSDYPGRIAAVLLDEALRLNPSNAQVWKLRIELAQQSADFEGYERALVAYLRTGVQDDKAQHDLLIHRLAQQNTLDAQYRAVEQLLESEGARRLSDPLRSRLASFAAAAAAELVDPDEYARWAVEAARLDPTNAEAAEMLYGIVIERNGDIIKQGTALINIVRSRPLDAQPRIELAAVLASQGLFDRAAQQYQVAGTRLSAGPLPIDAYRNWAHCLVALGQDTVALQLIEELETALKGPPPAEGEAGEPAPPQEPAAMLPVDLEVLRLSTLDSETDTDAAVASFARLRKAIQTSPSENADAQLAIVAAVFGPDLAEAQALADALPEDAALKPVALGWIEVRQGKLQAAAERLQPLAADNILADCGLAIAGAQDDAGRARELRRVLQIAPTSIAAIAAASRLRADGQSMDPTREGRALGDHMTRYPEGLWLVDVERSPWLDVRMVIQPARFQQTEPIQVEVTIWNTTRFPLAIGDDQPIRPQALILLSAKSAGIPLPPMDPIVIDLGRRLVLQAGERMTFTTRIDYSQFGQIVAINYGAGIAFDARLIVNPVITGTGSWLPAGVGGISIARDCLIQGPADTSNAIDKWLADITAESQADRLRALGRLAQLNKQAQPQIVNAARERQIREAILAAWPNLTPSERARVVYFGHQLETDAAILGPLTEQVLASDDTTLWITYLATQVADADSPILREAIKRQDLPKVVQFAEAMRRLMRELEEAADATAP